MGAGDGFLLLRSQGGVFLGTEPRPMSKTSYLGPQGARVLCHKWLLFPAHEANIPTHMPWILKSWGNQRPESKGQASDFKKQKVIYSCKPN